MEPADAHSAFSIPDLWRPSDFALVDDLDGRLFAPLEFDSEAISWSVEMADNLMLLVTTVQLHNPYAAKISIEDLRLPEIESFHYGQLQALDALEGSVTSTDDENLRPEVDNEEDIWGLALIPRPSQENDLYFTWEDFLETKPHDDIHPPYLSEWGARAFDEAVRTNTKTQQPSKNTGSVVNHGLALKALYDVGLGRSSVMFEYDKEKKIFVTATTDTTSTGHTGTIFSSLSEQLMANGAVIKTLRTFVESTYMSRSIAAGWVALANAVSSILSALEAHLSQARPQLQSLLQLQHVFERPRQILKEIVDLVDSLKSAKTDEDISSAMFRRCERYEHDADWLRSIMFEILARVSKPFLEKIDEWVGFSIPNSSSVQDAGLSFIACEPVQGEDGSPGYTKFVFQPQLLPGFIPLDEGRLIFETGQNLRLLRSEHPGHPLTENSSSLKNSPTLSWKFDWPDVEAVVDKAKRYEESLANSVRKWTTKPTKYPESLFGVRRTIGTTLSLGENSKFDLVYSMEQLDQIPSDESFLADELYRQVVSRIQHYQCPTAFDQDAFVPPISLAPILSFSPLLTAQARLLNGACLRLFFRSHHVRTHFNLQRSFHLMGDGVFVTRLSSALFDPNASTTERELGVMRSGTGMGLKLGDRSTWPPASSELRLALMGILSDCYRLSPEYRMHESWQGGNGVELPGSLSFAIRNLSKEEADKILDPSSLHALDFLRLQYSPPSPLHAVITLTALEKYDTIFRFLLRLVRLLFVVAHLPRRKQSVSATRFGTYARHFVNTCSQYFFETGVRDNWNEFNSYLDQRESSLETEDRDEPRHMGDPGGIDDLRMMHEACLDKMLFSLLLRNRQQKMMALLEEIFGTILKFETLCRDEVISEDHFTNLEATFLEKVSVFLNVCKGLVGKKGYGAGQGKAETGIEKLLIVLDWNGFYSLRRK